MSETSPLRELVEGAGLLVIAHGGPDFGYFVGLARKSAVPVDFIIAAQRVIHVTQLSAASDFPFFGTAEWRAADNALALFGREWPSLPANLHAVMYAKAMACIKHWLELQDALSVWSHEDLLTQLPAVPILQIIAMLEGGEQPANITFDWRKILHGLGDDATLETLRLHLVAQSEVALSVAKLNAGMLWMHSIGALGPRSTPRRMWRFAVEVLLHIYASPQQLLQVEVDVETIMSALEGLARVSALANE